MFVFEMIDTGAFGLRTVSTKAHLPFDEYIVVAGRVQCSQQLTCVGGRVKRDGKRRLLVIPIPRAQDIETVHVLDAGEVAVSFLQGVRACFPTLMRKNPMMDDDDDDSGSEEEEKIEEACKKQKHETKRLNDIKAQQVKTEASKYMRQITVKVLATLYELFNAFQIAEPTSVHSSLQTDLSIFKHYQLLCMDCPPSGTADNRAHFDMSHHAFSSSAPSEPFNFGVLFLEMATTKDNEQLLHIPVPRSPRLPISKMQEYKQESFQDATVLTFGTKREESAHGGGKTCEEMIQNIRMRHASGTFCTLVLPTKTWEQVVDEHKAYLPEICELQGKLRLRRLMGNAPCGVPIELLLEQ